MFLALSGVSVPQAQESDEGARVEKLILNGDAALRVPAGITGHQLGWIELYDSADGGRELWKSPAMEVRIVRGKARFKATHSRLLFTPAATNRSTVYVQFRVGKIPLIPRYMANPEKVAYAWDSFHRPYYALRLDLQPVPTQGDAVGFAAAWQSESPAVASTDVTAPVLRAQDIAGVRAKTAGKVPTPPRPPKTDPAKPARVDLAKFPPAILPPPASAPNAKPSKSVKRGLGPSLEDFRLANNLYFDALRAYREGAYNLALYLLEKAGSLNPDSMDIKVARERVRGETKALGKQEDVPSADDISREAIQRAHDLYFEALRNYAKGRFKNSRRILLEARQLDEYNAGVNNALDRIDHEMSLLPDVH